MKIGKLRIDECGVGVRGTDFEIGEALITRTGVAVDGGAPAVAGQTAQPAAEKHAVRDFLRDVGVKTAVTIASTSLVALAALVWALW